MLPDWSALLLIAPAALWLWTLAARLARWPCLSLASSPAQGANQPKGQQPHRRPAAQGIPVFAVKGGGVAARVRGARIALGSACPAAALAAPAHRVAIAGEAVPMAQETAAQH
jgi:hypothetical protein